MRVNALVAKAQKTPDEGWIMQDGTAWPGNNSRDHPGMIQVAVYSFGLFKYFKGNRIEMLLIYAILL